MRVLKKYWQKYRVDVPSNGWLPLRDSESQVETFIGSFYMQSYKKYAKIYTITSKTLKAAKRDISYVYPFCNTCDHNMHHKSDVRLR